MKAPPLNIGINYTDPKHKADAERLGNELNLPVTENIENEFDFTLRYTAMGLELFQSRASSQSGAVRAEFIVGSPGYRRVRGGREMLIRAIGHKGNEYTDTKVLDATGGLGRDAFIMASHGFQVHVIEKNPIVGALLADGLKRAAENPQTRDINNRILLTIEDSLAFLQDLKNEEKFDVIYLDPMFPKRKKKARVKKELYILQQLIGEDDNSVELFETALECAVKRVVVKRPQKAPHLYDKKPSYSLDGKTTRFDVYLAKSLYP